MQIICPHCTTSYDVDPAKFGAGGRTVRCARCRETWQAYPVEAAVAAGGVEEVDAGWGYQAEDDSAQDNTPHISSPSIAADWLHSEDDSFEEDSAPQRTSHRPEWLESFLRPMRPLLAMPFISRLTDRLPALPPMAMPQINLSVACTAMAALSLGLIIWRAEIVRLMPQTGTFFKMVGLGVNLRGLDFDKLKLSAETVDGKPVLVIEGALTNITRKPVELPRLRFIVRDANGNDIYAWNSVMEQTALKAGDRLSFKSRLASPPADGREIAVRFFQRRDLAAGAI
jgi:predicted Zn finger-like uncharacterized protein